MIYGFTKTMDHINLKDKIVADFGCGYGRWGHIIRSEVDQDGNRAYIVGCDIFKPYLMETRRYSPYDDLVLCDVKHLPFRDKSLDIAVAFELIEHLPKRDALHFLEALRKIVKETIVVSTPSGYYSQNEIRGNKFEKHVSRWTSEEFEKEGFSVIKTGLGIDLENLSSRFGLFNLLHRINCIRYRDSWGGVMLFCIQKIR